MSEERAMKTAELRKRIAELEKQIEAKNDALNMCALWFDIYAQNHINSGKTEKAETNKQKADFCRRNAE